MKTIGRWFVYGFVALSLFGLGCAGTKPVQEDLEAKARAEAEARKKKAEEEAARLKAEAEAKAREARMKAEAEARAREAQMMAETEAAARAARQLGPVYFDYDAYGIRDDQKAVLADHADKLKAVGEVSLTLEGHCDERGTIEYNLALGQKRADAVKNYLVRSGVEESRLSTISYGKQRPAVAGRDEAAWSKNRRVEFTAAP